MRHASWEWLLVVPCTLTAAERAYVNALPAGRPVRVMDRAELDERLAVHAGLETPFNRDQMDDRRGEEHLGAADVDVALQVLGLFVVDRQGGGAGPAGAAACTGRARPLLGPPPREGLADGGEPFAIAPAGVINKQDEAFEEERDALPSGAAAQFPLALLACCEVDRSTITCVIGEVRPLHARRGCTVDPEVWLRTLCEVLDSSASAARPGSSTERWSSPRLSATAEEEAGTASKLPAVAVGGSAPAVGAEPP
ncbi:hypothetical protein [Streptomyces sp. NPDC102462]|uniref:hypothetical protein n=1 Tax=Streptomyces sp. NPDC102462 TaxID=3366178 RepID=UPI003813D3B1